MIMNNLKKLMRNIFFIIIIGIFCIVPKIILAQSEEELKQKIEDRNREVAGLEKEIAEYQKQINEPGKQAMTLSGALKTLELTRKKLTTDISITQKKIDSVTLTIESLKRQIRDKDGMISIQRQALSKIIADMADADQTSLIEALLTYDNLGDFWNRQIEREQINGAINLKMNELGILKNDLKVTKDDTESKKHELERLRGQLADQRKIVEANKRENDKLLRETKNKESNYKKILADREAKKVAFQREITDYESQLRLKVESSSFPRPGLKALSWPTDNPFVTQEFGDTAFSRANPQAYNGNGHNGIDLKASIGTPIKAALSGVVWATGDTDTVCQGASYGKWVLIKHSNGLSTLYAHLSLIKTGEGQNVKTGELVGYSGNTGYSTGPHLHFTLYATQGVQIISKKSRVCVGTYRLPVADLKAYINPLLYL